MNYKDIAKEAKVSIAAVSFSLRNRPGVSETTRKRVLKVAEKLGYRPNPMVTALMAGYGKKRANRRMHTLLGCLITRETEILMRPYTYPRDCFAGMKVACDAAGFIFEKLYWEDFGQSNKKFLSTLRSRQLAGIVLIGDDVPAWCETDWNRYALASAGNRRANLPCAFAASDHYRNMILLIQKLYALNYRRIGCAMVRRNWIIRSEYRALAAYTGWAVQSGTKAPPPYWAEEWDKSDFIKWVKRHRPDVILSAEHAPLDYLLEAGYRVPEDIGFAHLGLQADWHHIAGMRPNNFDVGQIAVQLVIDQINHNQYGLPKHQRSIFVTSSWFEGPTVRPQK